MRHTDPCVSSERDHGSWSANQSRKPKPQRSVTRRIRGSHIVGTLINHLSVQTDNYALIIFILLDSYRVFQKASNWAIRGNCAWLIYAVPQSLVGNDVSNHPQISWTGLQQGSFWGSIGPFGLRLWFAGFGLWASAIFLFALVHQNTWTKTRKQIMGLLSGSYWRSCKIWGNSFWGLKVIMYQLFSYYSINTNCFKRL